MFFIGFEFEGNKKSEEMSLLELTVSSGILLQ